MDEVEDRPAGGHRSPPRPPSVPRRSASTRQNDVPQGKQMDALKNGIGAMVDADMEEASARLQALQVQQQLGIQALSIANQAPQNILSLFR
jgi:flagellin-like hook-associated protein FlgL